MKIAIVGCGFVADYYLSTLSLHPQLQLTGVMDRVPERARKFAAFHSVPIYDSLDNLLADPEVDIVLNLTNPRSPIMRFQKQPLLPISMFTPKNLWR